MKLSLCIPTYNRAKYLVNCLHSINIAAQNILSDVEVCISDNGSSDGTYDVVSQIKMSLPTKYHRHESNLGIPRNFLHVVNMACGEFVWLIGDDDLLLPDSLHNILQLIDKHPVVDFFYVNAFHLTTEYVLSFPQPFDTNGLPKDLKKFSTFTKEGEMPFIQLISPEVSFDFLGGMFLAVFKRDNWMRHAQVLNQNALLDTRVFSHFDNTFPHVRIFAQAFAGSMAYFNVQPLIVSLAGAREWSPLYAFIHSVRLIEALKIYRKYGLPFRQYIKCRNFALNNFFPDLANMCLRPTQSGLRFVSVWKHIVSNIFYPNFYLSPFLYVIRRFKNIQSS